MGSVVSRHGQEYSQRVCSESLAVEAQLVDKSIGDVAEVVDLALSSRRHQPEERDTQHQLGHRLTSHRPAVGY